MQPVVLWVLIESHRWSHRWGHHIFANIDIDSDHPLWGFKDTEFVRKGSSHCATHLPSSAMQGAGKGWDRRLWTMNLGHKVIFQDWDRIVWIWSVQLLTAPVWMNITLPDHSEICLRCYESPLSCADLSHGVLLSAWSQDKMHVSAQQAWPPLFYSLYFCLLFPSRLGIQHYVTGSSSQQTPSQRQGGSFSHLS